MPEFIRIFFPKKIFFSIFPTWACPACPSEDSACPGSVQASLARPKKMGEKTQNGILGQFGPTWKIGLIRLHPNFWEKALAFRICYTVLLMSKCRGESDLGLCMILNLPRECCCAVLRVTFLVFRFVATQNSSDTAQRHSFCKSRSHVQT